MNKQYPIHDLPESILLFFPKALNENEIVLAGLLTFFFCAAFPSAGGGQWQEGCTKTYEDYSCGYSSGFTPAFPFNFGRIPKTKSEAKVYEKFQVSKL